MRVVLLGAGRPLQVAAKALSDANAVVLGGVNDRVSVADLHSWKPEAGVTIGYRYLLDAEQISVPPLGWFNIHSSLLPAYKGRAPLNWAILNGDRKLGVTMHRIDETVDGGSIVYQEMFALDDGEDVGDALEKCCAIYARFVCQLFEALRLGDVRQRPMPRGDDKLWPARTDADGEIDWTQTPEQIVRLVRATAPPYPGAWTTVGGRKLRILKASLDPA